ncbi:hypothetical protein EII25_03965 [Erysipelotrichaceae bacterium OH741_COT-311]|nr:hypothetical protein EII25_03965 [Erysipelotrichaceae bacterium OH741_COT-311]
MNDFFEDFLKELFSTKSLYDIEVKNIIKHKCVALLKKDFKDPDNRSIIYFSISGTEDYQGNVYQREEKRYIIDLILKGKKIINEIYKNAHILYCPLNDNSIRFHSLENISSCDIELKFLKNDSEYFYNMYMHECFYNMYMHECFYNMYMHECFDNMYMHECFDNMYMHECFDNMYMHEDFKRRICRYFIDDFRFFFDHYPYCFFYYYKHLKLNDTNFFNKLPIKYEINHYNCCERKILQNFIYNHSNFNGIIYVSKFPCEKCQCAIKKFKKITIKHLDLDETKIYHKILNDNDKKRILSLHP